MEEIYRKGFSQYLVQQLSLQKYDELIAQSDLRYLANDFESMTEAQKKDLMGLQYIYLRNELHIERLTEQQKQILSNTIDSSITDEIEEIILNTYKDIITPKKIEKEEDKDIETFYDSRLQPDFVTMNSLVLMLGTTSEFDKDGNYVSLEHEQLKLEELKKIASQMEEELNGKLQGVPIRVLVER